MVDRRHQRTPVSPDGGRQILTRRIGLRQAIVLDPAGVALIPLGRRQGLQPRRRHDCHLVQGRAQSFPDALETIETAHGREHVRGIGSLTPTRFDQAKIAQAVQQGIEHLLLGLALDQAGAELAQDGMVETGVGQGKS